MKENPIITAENQGVELTWYLDGASPADEIHLTNPKDPFFKLLVKAEVRDTGLPRQTVIKNLHEIEAARQQHASER